MDLLICKTTNRKSLLLLLLFLDLIHVLYCFKAKLTTALINSRNKFLSNILRKARYILHHILLCQSILIFLLLKVFIDELCIDFFQLLLKELFLRHLLKLNEVIKVTRKMLLLLDLISCLLLLEFAFNIFLHFHFVV